MPDDGIAVAVQVETAGAPADAKPDEEVDDSDPETPWRRHLEASGRRRRPESRFF